MNHVNMTSHTDSNGSTEYVAHLVGGVRIAGSGPTEEAAQDALVAYMREIIDERNGRIQRAREVLSG